MGNFGFIRSELEIKLLILYVLNQLPLPVSQDRLTELVMIDDGFDYFQYAECLSELVESQQVLNEEEKYQITDDGKKNLAIAEGDIAHSVKKKAERVCIPLIAVMNREMNIVTGFKQNQGGGWDLHLRLKDYKGDILNLKLLTSSEEQASNMEKYFRAEAEKLYFKIVDLLIPPLNK